MKKYCSSCGGLNEFSINPPNFCQKCGQKMNNLEIKAEKFIPKNKNNEDEEQNPELEKFIDNLDTSQLGAEIIGVKQKGISFGEVAKQQKTGFTREPFNQKLNIKEFMAETAKKTVIDIGQNFSEE